MVDAFFAGLLLALFVFGITRNGIVSLGAGLIFAVIVFVEERYQFRKQK